MMKTIQISIQEIHNFGVTLYHKFKPYRPI